MRKDVLIAHLVMVYIFSLLGVQAIAFRFLEVLDGVIGQVAFYVTLIAGFWICSTPLDSLRKFMKS